jgi:hypothetical protein
VGLEVELKNVVAILLKSISEMKKVLEFSLAPSSGTAKSTGILTGPNLFSNY